MSEIRNTLSDVIAERAPVFGDQFKNVRTGRLFWAEVSDQGYLALVGALTKDLREKIKFWTTDRAAVAEILPTDVLLFMGVNWSALSESRVDNPASVQVSFECRKIIAGKDT